MTRCCDAARPWWRPASPRPAPGRAACCSARLGDLPRHGRREEQRLALRRQLADDPPDVVDEAHVEHAVGLVEDEDVRPGRAERAPVLHQVEQAARASRPGRRRRARARGSGGLIGTPPMASATRRAKMAPVGLEALDDLGGQFAGRAQHQDAAGALAAARLRFSARRWRIGSAKAAVLPVPVWAMPTTSRPASTWGMVWAWIGVGVV